MPEFRLNNGSTIVIDHDLSDDELIRSAAELEDWHMPDDKQPPLLDVAACIGLWAMACAGIVLEVLGQ